MHTWTIIAGACLITLVGAIDDYRPLKPQWKLLGQVAAALIAVEGGAIVTDVTIPFIGSLTLPNAGGVLTVIWLVGLMNVVNFSDGIDGLAAGLCTIDGIAFAIVAIDLDVNGAGVLAALTAGAALGFLFHNFYPASVFMGDSGANLLGFLLGVVAVIGSVKTGAVVTLVVPLIVLAVPFLDTGFVVAKRLKYRRAPWSHDLNHFHHRMARMGYGQRRTVLYLYGWSLMLAGVAVALRFVPYSNHNGTYHLGWLLVMAAIGVIAVAASVYLIYLLEILKFRNRRSRELRTADPDTPEDEIDERVQREVETGRVRAGGVSGGRAADSRDARDAGLSGLTRTEKAILGAIAALTVLAGVTRYAHGISPGRRVRLRDAGAGRPGLDRVARHRAGRRAAAGRPPPG